jgi:hypothetical protein
VGCFTKNSQWRSPAIIFLKKTVVLKPPGGGTRPAPLCSGYQYLKENTLSSTVASHGEPWLVNYEPIYLSHPAAGPAPPRSAPAINI